MDDKEIKYHEHEFERVEKPAVKQAKTLCWFVLAVCVGGLYFYLQAPPETKALMLSLIDAYGFWPEVITGAIVALFAIRAHLS